MAIYDCFTYYKETEVLRIRLEELRDVVDQFVAVEADETFRGTPKHWSLNHLDLPPDLKKKIEVVRITFPEELDSPWAREEYQRNRLFDAAWGLDDRDLILFSDCDEIPRAQTLETIYSTDQPVQLDVDLYYMLFDWRVPTEWNQGGRPMALKVGQLNGRTPHDIRSDAQYVESRIPDAGWHFSYFGGIPFMQEKIHAFSHYELDTQEFTATTHLKLCIDNGIDPFNRFLLEKVDPWTNDSLPTWVKEHLPDLHDLRLK